MRSVIILICLFTFLYAMTIFYQKLATVKMDWNTIDRWRFCIFAFGTYCGIVFNKLKSLSFFPTAMIWLFDAVLILTYAIIIGIYFLWIHKPYDYLICLDKGCLLALCVITFFAVKERLSRIFKFYKSYE